METSPQAAVESAGSAIRGSVENALRESESRLIVDSLPALVATFDRAGKLEFVNRQILEYFGRPAEALQDWTGGGMIHPEDLARAVNSFNDSIATGRPFDFEIRARRFDGAYRWFQSRGYPLQDPNGEILRWYNLLIDIDERKRAEEALNRARSELAHVARITTMNALTASIAHEMNQPLSGLITNAGTCVRMLASAPPDLEGARETARRMVRDGNRAAEVITHVRALFSKKEFALESLDVNDLTREVMALSSGDLQEHRITLRLQLEADLPAVTGDRIQLQQVILNLVRNATEAMAAVDDRPRDLLLTTAFEDPDHVRLSVRDCGPGVDPEDIPELFHAFHTTKPDGMGIGLSISRSIVERHHGRLWVEPNDGPGATFHLAIPVSAP